MVDAKALKEMVKKFSKGVGYAVTVPFALPTYFRKYWGDDDVCGMLGGLSLLEGVGVMACLGFGIGFGNFYVTAVGAGIVSTNSVSGIYKWYRYELNKLENPVKVSELEEKVDEPVKPEEEPKESKEEEKLTFINPFEVDLPEVEK